MAGNMFNPELKLLKQVKGERIVHRVTFTPSSAESGDTIRVELPPLSKDTVFVPKSLKLLFELEVEAGVASNHTVFNVSRNLVDNFSVKFGGHTVSDIRRYDLYEGYHDLLKIDHNMLMGITNEVYRKTRANATGKSNDAKIVKHCNNYGKTYHIPLHHPIIDEHGCYNSKALDDKIEFGLHFAKKGDIVITSDNTKLHSFKLNKIRFEYTTTRNKELADQISKIYENGKTFHFEDVHLMKVAGPLNFSTQKEMIVKINRSVRAMKGVLFLFTKTYAAGARDTEEFINPLISSVRVTIDGTPHSLYSDGITPIDVWGNILKKVGKVYNEFKEFDFLNDKYGLWVDLREEQDNMLHGDGKQIGDKGDGLVIEITLKSAETSVNCHTFVVSDASVFVQDGRVSKYHK